MTICCFFCATARSFPAMAARPLAALGVFGGGRSFFGGGELRLEFRLLLGPLRRSRVHVHRGVFLGGRLGGGAASSRSPSPRVPPFPFPKPPISPPAPPARPFNFACDSFHCFGESPSGLYSLRCFFHLQLRRGLISLGGDRGEFLDRLLRASADVSRGGFLSASATADLAVDSALSSASFTRVYSATSTCPYLSRSCCVRASQRLASAWRSPRARRRRPRLRLGRRRLLSSLLLRL